MKPVLLLWAAGLLFMPAVCAAQFDQDGRNQEPRPSTYEPDLNGKPSARLRIVSNHPDNVFPAYAPGDHCSAFDKLGMPMLTGMKGGIFGRKWRRDTIGMPMPDIPADFAFIEQPIRANERFTLVMRSISSDNRTCIAAALLVPKPNGNYEALFTESSSAGRRGCRLTVQELVETSNGKVGYQPTEFTALPACRLITF